MKYKGIELKEITEPGNIVFPKKMVVWDNIGLGSNEPCVRKVHALVKDNVGITRVIASQLDKDDAGVAIWNHCAEIPDEAKPRRATWKELAYWLMDGKGLVLDSETGKVDTGVFFDKKNLDEEVGERWKVMRRGDNDWNEITAEYMGL